MLLMRYLFVLMVLAITGCGATPYADVRFSYQIDGMSDWVLQPERDWVEDRLVSLSLQAGAEWDKSQCYVDTILVGGWDQVFAGCSYRFGSKWYIEPALMHQIDSLSSDFISTDEKQWQGHNPFMHLRAGYAINPAFRVQIATGKSLFQGAPFESEDGNPDLYWTNIEFAYRIGGKHGLFSKEHLSQ